MLQSSDMDGEWRFRLTNDTESGSFPWRLETYQRSGDEWKAGGEVGLPALKGVESDPLPSPATALGVTDTDAQQRINQTALAVVSQLSEHGSLLLGDDLDHWHCTFTTYHRWTEDADLLDYWIGIQVTLCPAWQCGEQDDHGIAEWYQSPHSGKLVDAEGRRARSDEELAALAIQKVCADAHVWKIPESDRSLDLAVDFPEPSDTDDALVEVTMHTDSRKRELRRAKATTRFRALRQDWQIRFLDSRGIGSYDDADVLSVKQIPPLLVDALRQIEQKNVDDSTHIAEACEQAIADRWLQPSETSTETALPLKVLEVSSDRPEGSAGSIRVSVAPLTSNFRNVVDVSDLKSAIQACTDSKLVKYQWGDTEKNKWLVIVLDSTEAAIQLLGDAFAFDDRTPDFSDIQFPGIDEVWTIVLDDDKLAVLRFIGSNTQWKHYEDIPIA